MEYMFAMGLIPSVFLLIRQISSLVLYSENKKSSPT
ncbi:hypothetical protein SAMN05444162_3072 [Paenibacillaceae bacterium GAS479]|nr:hypothetical protein SAMN05444162_3072 [Paenibacillaceae bacterium GAS479]